MTVRILEESIKQYNKDLIDIVIKFLTVVHYISEQNNSVELNLNKNMEIKSNYFNFEEFLYMGWNPNDSKFEFSNYFFVKKEEDVYMFYVEDVEPVDAALASSNYKLVLKILNSLKQVNNLIQNFTIPNKEKIYRESFTSSLEDGVRQVVPFESENLKLFLLSNNVEGLKVEGPFFLVEAKKLNIVDIFEKNFKENFYLARACWEIDKHAIFIYKFGRFKQKTDEKK